MGVVSQAGISFKLVSGTTILDLFQDEQVFLSDNITGLFDIGLLPSTFSRNINIPATQKNNDFFNHYYDISVESPFLFDTNIKVDAYIDYDGFYLAQGYLQLNKVNLGNGKFIDSYDVSIFGLVSSFARDISRSTLNDLSTLTQYNHTSSFDNISASWGGNLFNGDIVYPLADYGKGIYYDYQPYSFGVNKDSGSLGVEDFKPAIRVKKVLDAIFDEYGYVYESDFLTSSFFDNIYMICDRDLKYPVYDDIDLNTFGQIRISPVSGSFTDIVLTSGSYQQLVYENVEYDPENRIDANIEYNTSTFSAYKGKIKIVCQVSGSNSGSVGMPQFNLQAYRTSGTPGNVDNINLERINKYFREWDSSQDTGNVTHTVEEDFVLNLVSGSYQFRLKYDAYNGNNFVVTLNPDSNTQSYLSIEEVTNAADLKIMNIPENMPFGQSGIKQVDFIRGLQQKYNLIIYPSKSKPNTFIIDTFNNWYKKGVVKSFDKFIDLDKGISVTPANNLAVNKLEFGDSLGKDLLAQNFDKENNRSFGKSIYIDNQNYFSQGEFKVEPVFSVSPLRYVTGTGVSGSFFSPTQGIPLTVNLSNQLYGVTGTVCNTYPRVRYLDSSSLDVGVGVYKDIYLTQPETDYLYIADTDIFDIWSLSSNGVVTSYVANCRDFEE
jgi:hypothetical protein